MYLTISSSFSQRPKRVVYYLAELTDSSRILPTGEGVQFSWCNIQQATDKALYKNMQDVLRMAFSAADANRAKALAAAPPKIHRNHSNNSGGDSLESNMKNLNIALPLDSQRQAITRDYNNNRHGGIGQGQNRDRGDRDGNSRFNNNGGNNNNGMFVWLTCSENVISEDQDNHWTL